MRGRRGGRERKRKRVQHGRGKSAIGGRAVELSGSLPRGPASRAKKRKREENEEDIEKHEGREGEKKTGEERRGKGKKKGPEPGPDMKTHSQKRLRICAREFCRPTGRSIGRFRVLVQ